MKEAAALLRGLQGLHGLQPSRSLLQECSMQQSAESVEVQELSSDSGWEQEWTHPRGTRTME